jgi:hypothetical protein
LTTTNLNLYQVNTIAWDEEDFILLTSLTEEQITEVITPIVEAERENNVEYDNDALVEALKKAYPNAVTIKYTINGIDLISI